MATYFVSRHHGAVEWIKRQPVIVDRFVPHLDPQCLDVDDIVIGTLPLHLAAAVCARGARYLHLAIDLPAHLRGHELAADELARWGARLEAFEVVPSRG